MPLFDVVEMGTLKRNFLYFAFKIETVDRLAVKIETQPFH